MMDTETAKQQSAFSDQPLGIIAGSGDLPLHLVKACRNNGREVFVIAFNGQTNPDVAAGVAHIWIDIADIARVTDLLQQAEVIDIVMAGKIPRPPLSSLRPTIATTKLLARLGTSLLAGDDSLFKTIVSYMEGLGFNVIGVDDILQDMLTPTGTLGKIIPVESTRYDIKEGVRIAHGIGRLDIGQAVVICGSQVIGVEAAEGTDALIERCGALIGSSPETKSGVLIKAKKPGQERRVDLPAAGVTTVEKVYAAGLEGIALEAGGSLIIDRKSTITKANELGIFLLGFTSDDENA